MRIAAILTLAASLAAFRPAPQSQDGGLQAEDAGFGFLPSAELLNFPYTGSGPIPPKFVGKLDAWVPFQAVLINDGPAREGILTVRPFSTAVGEAITYTKRVSLPRDGRKRITFPVRATFEPMGMSFRDDSAGALRINGEKDLSIQEPRIVSPRTEVILLATDAKIAYSHLVVASRRRRDSSPGRVLVVVPPEQLPHTALEYDAAGLLILDDIAADSLSPAQASAIHQWVCRGGTVVITLLRNAHRIKGTHLEPLLAAQPGLVKNVKEMKDFEQATAQRCGFDVETAVQTFALPGDPAIAYQKIERGVALACGLPLSSPVLESWTEAPRLLEAFIRLGRQARIPLPGGMQAQRVRESLAPALKGSILKSVPPFRAVAILMAAYVWILIIVPYAIFRPFKRLEFAWIGVVLLALAGSGVVYGVGVQYLRTQSVACRVTLVEGGAAAGPHVRHNFWCLFSAKGGAVNLGFEDPPVVPFPFGGSLGLRGAGSASEPLLAAFDGDAQIRAFPTFAQDSVLFETTDAVALPGKIAFQVRVRAGVLEGRLDVDPTFPLKDAWVVDGERVVRVRPGAFEISGAGPRGTDSGNLFERQAIQGVIQALSSPDPGNRAPILLYRYDGAPSLTNKDIQEDAIHFGIVEPSAWIDGLENHVNWYGTIYLPSEPPVSDTMTLEFTLRTRDVPSEQEITNVTIAQEWGSIGTVEVYNRAGQEWSPMRPDLHWARYIARTPYGGLAIKARLTTRGPMQSHQLFSRRENTAELQVYAFSRMWKKQ